MLGVAEIVVIRGLIHSIDGFRPILGGTVDVQPLGEIGPRSGEIVAWKVHLYG